MDDGWNRFNNTGPESAAKHASFVMSKHKLTRAQQLWLLQLQLRIEADPLLDWRRKLRRLHRYLPIPAKPRTDFPLSMAELDSPPRRQEHNTFAGGMHKQRLASPRYDLSEDETMMSSGSSSRTNAGGGLGPTRTVTRYDRRATTNATTDGHYARVPAPLSPVTTFETSASVAERAEEDLLVSIRVLAHFRRAALELRGNALLKWWTALSQSNCAASTVFEVVVKGRILGGWRALMRKAKHSNRRVANASTLSGGERKTDMGPIKVKFMKRQAFQLMKSFHEKRVQERSLQKMKARNRQRIAAIAKLQAHVRRHLAERTLELKVLFAESSASLQAPTPTKVTRSTTALRAEVDRSSDALLAGTVRSTDALEAEAARPTGARQAKLTRRGRVGDVRPIDSRRVTAGVVALQRLYRDMVTSSSQENHQVRIGVLGVQDRVQSPEFSRGRTSRYTTEKIVSIQARVRMTRCRSRFQQITMKMRSVECLHRFFVRSLARMRARENAARNFFENAVKLRALRQMHESAATAKSIRSTLRLKSLLLRWKYRTKRVVRARHAIGHMRHYWTQRRFSQWDVRATANTLYKDAAHFHTQSLLARAFLKLVGLCHTRRTEAKAFEWYVSKCIKRWRSSTGRGRYLDFACDTADKYRRESTLRHALNLMRSPDLRERARKVVALRRLKARRWLRRWRTCVVYRRPMKRLNTDSLDRLRCRNVLRNDFPRFVKRRRASQILMVRAEIHRDYVRLRQSVRSWHERAIGRGESTNRFVKVIEVMGNVRRRQALRRWARTTTSHAEDVQKAKIRRALARWRDYAVVCRVRKVRRVQLLRYNFTAWNIASVDMSVAFSYYRDTLSQRVFTAWRTWVFGSRRILSQVMVEGMMSQRFSPEGVRLELSQDEEENGDDEGSWLLLGQTASIIK